MLLYLQEINDQKRANEIARADMEKAKSDLRTCKSHLEESQSEVRKLESANQRLADEAETARADRDEARGKVTHLMDESAEVWTLQPGSFHLAHETLCTAESVACCGIPANDGPMEHEDITKYHFYGRW